MSNNFFKNFSWRAVLPETKIFFRLSLPLILANIVQSASPFVAVMMLAHVGQKSLAALSIVNGIYVTVIVFAWGLLSAVGVLVAIAYGAKDDKGVANATAQGLYAAVALSLFSALIIEFTPYLLRLSGQDPEVIRLAIPPLHAYVLSAVTSGLLISFEQFLIGIGRMRLILLASLFEVPLEIIAYYVLVFGKFGFPKMGIAGIGYGFAIVFSLTMLFLMLIVKFSKSCRQYKILAAMKKIDWHILKEIFRIGTPSGLMYVIEVAFWTVLTFLMGRLSVTSLAAHQLTTQYSGLTFMIMWAMAQATGTRVGHVVGEKNLAAVKLATYVASFWSFFLMLFLMSFYWLVPYLAISVDLDIYDPANGAIIGLVTGFMAVMAVGQLGDTLRFIASSALRSLKDTKVPLIVSACSFWFVGLPFGYWLAFICRLGGRGLWAGGALSAFLIAAILWYRLQKLIAQVDLKVLALD